MKVHASLTTVFATALALLGAVAPAGAAGLAPGEYACSGASGILIGLGFKVLSNGTYTDLDGKTSGSISYNGSNITFVGGHLAGQVGVNVQNNSFTINSIFCSRN